jgi:hypothetical protein
MMGKTTKKKFTRKSKTVTDKSVADYANDPYFVKKREIAAAFLKKAGLTESFKKLKQNRKLSYIIFKAPHNAGLFYFK